MHSTTFSSPAAIGHGCSILAGHAQNCQVTRSDLKTRVAIARFNKGSAPAFPKVDRRSESGTRCLNPNIDKVSYVCSQAGSRTCTQRAAKILDLSFLSDRSLAKRCAESEGRRRRPSGSKISELAFAGSLSGRRGLSAHWFSQVGAHHMAPCRVCGFRG